MCKKDRHCSLTLSSKSVRHLPSDFHIAILWLFVCVCVVTSGGVHSKLEYDWSYHDGTPWIGSTLLKFGLSHHTSTHIDAGF